MFLNSKFHVEMFNSAQNMKNINKEGCYSTNASPNIRPPVRIPAGHQSGQGKRAKYGRDFIIKRKNKQGN
jgi:hypothetical protein